MHKSRQRREIRWGQLIARLIPAGAILAVWQAVISAEPQLAFFIGSPVLYFQAFKSALEAGTQIYGYQFPFGKLVIDALVTAAETMGGFVLGNFAGIVLGLWLSRNARVAFIFKPYIILLGAAPLFAFAPIIVLWFGIGLSSKIIVAGLSTLFVALMQTFKGATQVSRDLVQVAQAFGASERQTFRKIVVPSAAVWVINAFRLNVGFALLGAFLGEFINSSNGLGHLILVAGGLYNIPLVLVGVTTISFLGLVLTLMVDSLEPLAKKVLSRAF